MRQKLSPEFGKDMIFVKEFGYRNEHEFIKDAIQRRISDLKKASFVQSAHQVRQALRRAKLSESDILQDFAKQSYKHS